MPLNSVGSFVDAVRRSQLLDAVQLKELTRLHCGFPDARALAKELLQRGWLTPYQANQLYQGNGLQLVLGPYLLMDKLGEGGMGTVFKARYPKMGRVVALKVIRKERVGSETAIRRFQREVRAAAQLSHPNVVHALDADQIGDTHILVMEYVEARSLYQLVKQTGALPIGLACDYIRQAALGLQHAFEKGMIHRDIKPHNLLVTKLQAASERVVTVKILDFGLVLLNHPDSNDEVSGRLTRLGVVVGTPDYFAPEQGMGSPHVDGRADLYSLGCTFYFALTGRQPFPGGSLEAKVLKHQLDEPIPVEQLRAEIPSWVGEIVRKLMAKRPEDRYQTAKELANILDCGLPIEHCPTATMTAVQKAAPMAIPLGMSQDSVPTAIVVATDWSGGSGFREDQSWIPRTKKRAESLVGRLASKRGRWLGAGIGAVVFATCLTTLIHETANSVSQKTDTETIKSIPTKDVGPGIVEPGNVALATNGSTVSGQGQRLDLLSDGITAGYDGGRGYALGIWPCEWFVTLPKLYKLREIRILIWDGDMRFYRYAIETSEDGKTFVPLADHSRGKWRSWQVLTFSPRPVKVIKVHGLFNSSNRQFHLVELEAYCTPPADIPVPLYQSEPET